MKLERDIYFIVTKGRPTKFHMGDGNMEGDYEDAEMYLKKSVAENVLSTFDEPQDFEIISGTMKVEI